MSQKSFRELGVSAPVVDALAARSILEPFRIQELVLPDALAGLDVLAKSPTGSGKTLAFGLPIVERIAANGDRPAALVLVPTRELAAQVTAELESLARPKKLSVAVAYGGVPLRAQAQRAKSAHILVATPGRLEDLAERRLVDLTQVRTFVLDEADRMLDMGFAPDVERILRQCPPQRQTLLFSATMPEWVRRLALRHMHDPETVEISTRPEIPSEVRQLYVRTTWADKTDALAQILDQPDVVMALIFVETKRTADVLQAQLGGRGYQVGLLHGDLTQRDRDRAMQQFRASHIKYLIATNVAARGLDIDDISHVINYDVPLTPDEYLHRVGRTGRAGRAGVAVTLITPSEILKLRDVEKHARTHIEPATLDEDFPATVVSAQA
jgi:superfamily II DNA/RNA helicase